MKSTDLTRVEVGRHGVVVVFGRWWERGTLQNGRVAEVFGARHVDEDVHARTVLERVVKTGPRARRWRAAVVPDPVAVVVQRVVPAAPALFEVASRAVPAAV